MKTISISQRVAAASPKAESRKQKAEIMESCAQAASPSKRSHGDELIARLSANPKGIASLSPGLRGWPVRLGPSYPGCNRPVAALCERRNTMVEITAVTDRRY